MLEWNDAHPYNAVHVVRIPAPLDLERLRGILDATDEELVSVDFNGNAHSSIVDLASTAVIDGTMVKVLAWYDNEWGYSNRVKDLIRYMSKSL